MPGMIRLEFFRRRVLVALTLIVACGLLVACGTGDKESPEAIEPATATVAPTLVPTALSGPPVLGNVVWATEIEPQTDAPIHPATPVIGDTTIYAVFPIVSLPAGSQLIASWYFNDTSLDALNSAMRIDRDRVDGWVEFHIERTGSEPWPDGVYEVVVSDGTNELQRAEIAIS